MPAVPTPTTTPVAPPAPFQVDWRKSLFPNRTATAICAVGMAVECLLAWSVPTHALWAGGPATVASTTFLIVFWFLVAHGARWLSLRCAQPPSLRSAIFVRYAIIASLPLFVVCYCISWGLCLQTGRFASWEAVWFAMVNASMLWDYLVAADPKQLVAMAVVLVSGTFGLPWLGRRLTVDDRTPDEQRAYCLRPLMLVLLLGTTTLWQRAKICDDLSIPRQVDRMHRMATALNPLVTLGTSVWFHWTAEPIRACLDESQLEPIAGSAGDAPPMEQGVLVDSRMRGTAACATTQRPRASVLVIAVESLRHDMIGLVHQGREVMPHLNRLSRAGLHLTRAYAQSTHSDYADVCIPSSLYPLRSRSHHFYRSDDPWPKTLLHDILRQEGYATAIISSQNEAWGGMDQFLDTPGLDWFYHPQRSDAPSMVSERDPGFWREHLAGTLLAGKFPDRHTTDVALQWIADQAEQGKPFCLSMNFQSSHFPYLIPEDSPRPFQPATLPDDVQFSSYPPERTPLVRNAYYNALHECDRQIGRVVAELERLGQLDDTVLVITGENGEAFHENGCVGHAGMPVEPVVHVAAVIHAPGRVAAGREDYPTEHIDLAPTVLGLLHLRPHPNFQGQDILCAERIPAEQRLLFMHVLSPIARADAVLLGGRWKFVTGRDIPHGALYDLATDPTESTDVGARYPVIAKTLSHVLAKWRAQQLAYYYYPSYYLRYYPPDPPRWIAPPSGQAAASATGSAATGLLNTGQ